MKFFKIICILLSLTTTEIYAQQGDIAEGKKIFNNRCAGCHSINEVVVGPALRDADKRHSEQWIIDFVHSSQSVIKSGDTTAISLFNRFNHVVMPDHPDLNKSQIQGIIMFIKEQSLDTSSSKGRSKRAFNNPYQNKNSFLSQFVYLNLEDEHHPVKPNDFKSWALIGFFVLVLLILLYAAVFLNLVSDVYRHDMKPGNEITE